jgi:hypothetical protein
MRLPSRGTVASLLDWRAANGVISVYLEIDPGDRSGGWRIELRNRLDQLQEELGKSRELSETTARILARFAEDEPVPEGRAQIGFVEVGEGRARREEWFAAQIALDQTVVAHWPRPLVLPLIASLDRGGAQAIALASAERVRLLLWEMGTVAEIANWELEITSLDWRERKAQRPPDPGRASGVTASGHDQFDGRLDANRERFLEQAGGLTATRMRELGVERLIVVGPNDHSRALAEGASGVAELDLADHHDLIAARTGELGSRLGKLIGDLNATRHRSTVARVIDEARGGTRGALGTQEASQALEEGRVEELVLDAGGRVDNLPDEAESPVATAEILVEQALATGARVTPVDGDAAERLAEAGGGVGAVLRY